jgi:ABC-type transporter Mla subunit MlaD
MRRLASIIALGLTLPVLIVLGLGADGESGSAYEVRAIFDNVASAVPGEDVKVAGAKIGVIKSMDVTKDKKAAVTLRIDDARFTPFHANAKCTVRPQSLIGEKFVECNPGTPASPKLARIDRGPGEGEHLLPLAQTSSPVDLDLINNINRRPYRERLSILVNEFGTGLAGRGKDLNEVIHRANPALRETDKVLAILAKQNRVLARLAESSDRALAPLAREKRQLTGFIESAGDTATATAERREDIARGIQRLPAFLRELQPLMADLQGFAQQATPVATNLNRSGRDVSRVFEALGPFSTAATPSLETLGDALRTGRPAVLNTRPLVQDVGAFAKQAKPLSRNLDKLTASIDETDGIERLMETIYYTTLVVNGFDNQGYYQRANLLNNLCSTYQTATQDGCSARFEGGASASAAAAGTAPTPANAPEPNQDTKGATTGAGTSAPILDGLLGNGVGKKGREAAEGVRRRANSPGAKAKPEDAALDYLLGGAR